MSDFTGSPLRPRWVYNDGSAVDYLMSIPQRPYDMSSRGIGGSDVSAAGVPAAFEIRRDNLLRLTLRFPEHEWDDVERVVRHLQKAGSATFYPDQDDTSVAYTVYGESPAMGSEILPRRSAFPRVLELDVTLRRTTDMIFDDPFYSDALLYWLAGTDVTGSVFTRADIATYIDVDGILQTAATGVRRTTWLGPNGSRVPHYLSEGGRTNLCLQSEVLGTTWTLTRTTQSPNAVTAPDGATTADKLVDDATASATHAMVQNVTKAASALVYTWSIHVKAAEYNEFRLQIGDGGGTNFVRADVDLVAGTIGASTLGGDFTAGESGIEVLADGWFRVWVSGTSNTVTTIQPILFMNDGSGLSYNGDSASGLYPWGAQLEQAPFPSSYIKTVASSDARVADVLTFPFTAPPQEMTVYAKFEEGGTALTSSGAIVHIGDATATAPFLQIRQDTSTSRYEVVHDSGTRIDSALPGATPALGETVELRAELRADGSIQIGQSIESGPEVLSTASAANALTAAWQDQLIYIGSRGSGGQGFNAHAAVKIVPGIRSMAQMRAL